MVNFVRVHMVNFVRARLPIRNDMQVDLNGCKFAPLLEVDSGANLKHQVEKQKSQVDGESAKKKLVCIHQKQMQRHALRKVTGRHPLGGLQGRPGIFRDERQKNCHKSISRSSS